MNIDLNSIRINLAAMIIPWDTDEDVNNDELRTAFAWADSIIQYHIDNKPTWENT